MPDANAGAPDAPGEIVSAHILRRAKPGQLPALEEKVAATLALAAKAPGYVGSGVVRGTISGTPCISVLLHFASRADLERWKRSDAARQAFLDAAPHALEPPRIEVVEGTTGWFDLPEASHAGPPPKWKMAIVSWLAIFPLLTLFVIGTAPLLGHMHVVGRLFINTVLIAPLMTWVVMPNMTRLFRRWLFAG